MKDVFKFYELYVKIHISFIDSKLVVHGLPSSGNPLTLSMLNYSKNNGAPIKMVERCCYDDYIILESTYAAIDTRYTVGIGNASMNGIYPCFACLWYSKLMNGKN